MTLGYGSSVIYIIPLPVPCTFTKLCIDIFGFRHTAETSIFRFIRCGIFGGNIPFLIILVILVLRHYSMFVVF